MLKSYLDILKEDLNKKEKILMTLTALSEKQAELAKAEKFDLTTFDEIVDEKDALVQKLISLDDGFEETYAHIKEDLPKEKEQYAEDIKALQAGIRRVTDLSVALQALEERNRELISGAFRQERQKYKVARQSSKVALNYYKSMNRVNYIDPQLMDRKK